MTRNRCLRGIAAIAFLAILLLAPSAARSVLIDFEDHAAMDYWAGAPIPPEAQLSDAYLPAHGVRFESGSDYVAVVELGADHTTSGVNGIGGSTPSGILTYSREHPIMISFYCSHEPLTPGVTDSVSLRGDLQGSSQTITLNAYDIHGDLVASTSVLDSGGATLVVQAPGVHRVEFLGSASDNFGVAVDDLCYRAVTALPAVVAESTWSHIKALFRGEGRRAP